MITYHHDIARLKLLRYSACSICEQKLIYTKQPYYTDRHDNLAHIVSFIIMDPSLHDKDLFPVDTSVYEAASVSCYCRYRKMWNISVIHIHRVLNNVRHMSQTTAQDKGYIRNISYRMSQIRGSLRQLIVCYQIITPIIQNKVRILFLTRIYISYNGDGGI